MMSAGERERNYPPDVQKRDYRKFAEPFQLINGELYHQSKKCAQPKKVIVGEEERNRVLDLYHRGIGGGHFGMNATLRKLEKYWWKNMTSDVKRFCSSCIVCQKANPMNNPAPAKLHPVKISSRLFHRWGVDLGWNRVSPTSSTIPSPQKTLPIQSGLRRLEKRMGEIELRLKNRRQEGLQNLEKAQEKKDAYDLKRSGPAYNVGDKVLKRNARKDTRMGGKLEERFVGPYFIREVLAKGAFLLRDDNGKDLTQKVNGSNLRRVISPIMPSAASLSKSLPPSPPTPPLPSWAGLSVISNHYSRFRSEHCQAVHFDVGRRHSFRNGNMLTGAEMWKVQCSSKFSPFELMFGMEPRFPYELDSPITPEDLADPIWTEETGEEIEKRMGEIELRLKNRRQEEKQKDAYNLKRSGPAYNVGDKVLKRNAKKDTRMGGKLEER
ncbi:unnamed protein product [Darwinula stevensoni]|uniref:Integrase zinc-binding domain-containing protein n=1 Tax=Darwinula stevensoni TaxID=69355 RepID=A0A7R8XF60_9CRUS|nr:unnamed protein product [Darwinula stevensoni]CAG0891310.1 unnamed protein product [Darwinula stevensoni]